MNVLLCFDLAIRYFSGNFEVSRRQVVASLTALYSHKYWNSKFEGDISQTEYFARVEKDLVSVSQANLYSGNCDVVVQF
jgi:CRISPR/Cas system-associated endoribonuclease Cas2